MENLSTDPPEDIDPYKVLELEKNASPEEIKSAYKKLALRHHPDKVAESARNVAHIKFQELAFAYAILSEPRRRKRYDETGNTSESIDIDDAFDWVSYFKARFADVVTGETLDKFKDSYQRSEEEERDVLAAYKRTKGNMDKIFDEVMLSNPLYDEARFRQIIENAINTSQVEAFATFREEPDSKKTKRQKRAAQESAEAMEYAKELGVYETLFNQTEPDTARDTHPKGSKPRKSKKEQEAQQESALADMIQRKGTAKTDDFMNNLEAKYTRIEEEKKKGKGGKGTKRKFEEPPEELFQRNRQRSKKKAELETEHEDAEDEEDTDLGAENLETDDEEDEEEEEEGLKLDKTKSKTAKDRKGVKSGRQGSRVQNASTNSASIRKAPSRKVSKRR